MSRSFASSALVLLLASCSGTPETAASDRTAPTTAPPTTAPPVTAAPTPAPSATAPTVTPLFCTYGGVGIVPDPLPPGYETAFATVVVQVDNPGAPLGPITVGTGSLVDEHGTPAASLVRLDHFVVLPEIEPEGPTMGSFAVHLNPEGTPFDGTLPTGRTILRARFSIDASPTVYPASCHLELAGAPVPLVSDRPLDGVLPSS
jgi:hypothetical protein